MSKILVTGGNGFVAAQVIIAALKKDYQVVATVRNAEKGEQTKQALSSRVGDKIANLSFAIVPVIESEHAFDEVIKTNSFDAVLHTATPFYLNAKDPKEIVVPAVDSTKFILKSIQTYGPTVKRVVITSSFASVVDPTTGYRPGYVYTEKDWNPISWEQTNAGDPIDAYYGAKTWAERAAWDYVKENNPQFDLVTLCPPMIYGEVAQYTPSAKSLNTSSVSLYAVLTGQQKEIEVQHVMIFTNVQDIAQAHVLALEAPDAGNKRFLIANDVPFTHKAISDAFIKHFPSFAPNVPTKLPEGVDENGVPIGGSYRADNSLSKNILGLQYQNFEDTMVQFANSVSGLVESS
ncbi:methylglyoxal reductase (NADPH-dependent) gre2 [Serendipita sp. 399]|nr:methylglyoxal reductase (NADPH-dependent) gre2 [Serendipita sp. 399]